MKEGELDLTFFERVWYQCTGLDNISFSVFCFKFISDVDHGCMILVSVRSVARLGQDLT